MSGVPPSCEELAQLAAAFTSLPTGRCGDAVTQTDNNNFTFPSHLRYIPYCGSNGHVTDDVMWTRKVTVVTPICLKLNISKSARQTVGLNWLPIGNPILRVQWSRDRWLTVGNRCRNWKFLYLRNYDRECWKSGIVNDGELVKTSPAIATTTDNRKW